MQQNPTPALNPPDSGPTVLASTWHATSPARVLGWVYLGRVAIGAALAFRLPTDAFAAAGDSPFITYLVLATAFVTAASYGYTHVLRREPGRNARYAQVTFDALLLTAVVFLTGGQNSMFTPLYILVISAGALLLPFLGGILVGLLASVLYFAAAAASPDAPDGAVLLQASLFAVVAVATGYLGDRLRQTGAALGEVETELRRLKLDTDDVLESIGTGIITVDGQGRLAYLNPAAAELLSIRATEWLDQPVLEELDRIAPGLGRVIVRTSTTRTPVRRFETERIDENSFVLGVSTTILERSGSDRPPVTAIFQDITEKMRMEALRRRAERLEAVAELSASLAHEIKNPLASIRSAVEQIATPGIDADDSRVLGGLIIRETDRISRLLGEFIDFARVKVEAPEAVDIGALVANVTEVVRAHPDARDRTVTVTFRGPPTTLYIRGDEDVLHRAVFNLVLNAAQWAGERGEVDVLLDEVRSDLLSPALGAFRLIRLAVRDSGPGVPEDIRESIFDPFFTRRTGGTGLGLALVQRAVEAHGGAIFVDSAPGRRGGAVFSLYLPSLPPEAGSAPETRTATEAAQS
jgi:two-component system, NtrC family, sensor histidine kinase PilS